MGVPGLDGWIDGAPGAGLSERYELGDLIGVGGAAVVYRSWDRLLHRHVAVKLFDVRMPPTAGLAGSAEVRALSGLRHPGLVALYDAGIAAGRPFLVMQLIEGEPLSERIGRRPLSPAEAMAVGEGLASALACVHDHGVIHRDVKPANVLLDHAQRPCLVDFGIARFVDGTSSTVSGSVVGTPAFLAPEQVRGDVVGPAADVYALGLVMLEALTGRREYPGSAVESAVARLHRRPVPPTDLPFALRSLVGQMTDPDPAARPGAAAVASRLGSARRRQAEATIRLGRPVRPRSPLTRRRLGVAVGAIATALGMGFAVQVVRPDLATGTGPIAEDRRAVADPVPAAPTTTPAHPVAPAPVARAPVGAAANDGSSKAAASIRPPAGAGAAAGSHGVPSSGTERTGSEDNGAGDDSAGDDSAGDSSAEDSSADDDSADDDGDDGDNGDEDNGKTMAKKDKADKGNGKRSAKSDP